MTSTEKPLDPQRRIIDPHHHLWAAGQGLAGPDAYHHEDLLADIGGHNVVGTVYVESGTAYRNTGPEGLRPVGETEFAAAEARLSADSRAPILGIVAHADLTSGDALQDVLDAHAEAGCGLFRGIRQLAATTGGDLLSTPGFSEGFARLGASGYSFDAFVVYTQLPALAHLARAAPGTILVIDHLGLPAYQSAERRDEIVRTFAHIGLPTEGLHEKREDVMRAWRDGLRAFAGLPNVFLKLGGIGMDNMFGTGWAGGDSPPTSDAVVDWWGDDIHACIDIIGPDRCMFESNFPVDRWSLGYTSLWNAFQKIAARYSESEQTALFSGSAARAYRLPAGLD